MTKEFKIPTTPELILKYLARRKEQGHKFTSGGELERSISMLSKPSTVGRILRYMAEDGLLKKDYKKIGKISYVVYTLK